MDLKKWQFGTAMGEQIEAQNDNLIAIDANLTEIDTKITEIDTNITEIDTNITEINANLTKIDAELTEQNANIDTIDTFMDNIKDISYASLEDRTVGSGDFLALIQNKWAELPMGASILRVVAGGHGGGGIAYKSTPESGTVLILRNGMAPLVVQNVSTSWRTYNWGV